MPKRPKLKTLKEFKRFYNRYNGKEPDNHDHLYNWCGEKYDNIRDNPRVGPMLKPKWVKGRVLDAGCNGGAITAHIAENFDGVDEIVGLDIAEGYIKKNKKRFKKLKKAKWGIGSIEEMEYENEFDSVVCSEVLEHVLDPLVVVNKINCALKKNGILVGTVPNEGGCAEKGSWHDDYEEHLRVFNSDKLSRLLIDNGFSIIELKPIVVYNWLLFVAQKK